MEEQEVRARERIREEIAQFAALFPQVKPEDIPEGVWRQAKEGKSLALAYAMDALERLEREVELLRARSRGAALSPGSVRTAGSSAGTLASFWDAYEM